MSATQVSATCRCNSFLPEPVQCPDHFGIWRNGKRLTSVGRIVGLYPQEPCSQCHWPIYSEHLAGCAVKANIDNANLRGRLVESLLTQYLTNKPVEIPAGEYAPGFIDKATALFHKAADWFDKQRYQNIECQVLLADDEIGGVADFICDGLTLDLKTVYSLADTHSLQVGGYMSLRGGFGALLHITERKEPTFRIVEGETVDDFCALRDAYAVLARRGAFKDKR